MRLRQFVHVMGPKEPDNLRLRGVLRRATLAHNEATCTQSRPWTPQSEAFVVYHVSAENYQGEESRCPYCGVDTAKETKGAGGVFVYKALN